MNGLASPAGVCLAVPLAAAALLPLLRDRRAATWGNLAAAALCLAVAALLPTRLDAQGAWLRADHLSALLAPLAAFTGLAAAWAAAPEAAGGRLHHAAFQALLFCLLLSLLAGNLALAWAGLESAATIVALVPFLHRARAEAAWRSLLLCGTGLALALFGIVLLYFATAAVLGPGVAALSWAGLQQAAPRGSGALLGLGFAFVLVGVAMPAGLAPLHAWEAAGPAPLFPILANALPVAALAMILRLRLALAENAGTFLPGPALMALGLLSLLLAGFALWRRRGLARFLAIAGTAQTGIVAYAFGLGSPAACFAGLLHLVFLTLARTAAQDSAGRQGPGFITLALALLALAGLPPFGLFDSLFLVMTETLGRAPPLALPLGAGLVATGAAIAARLQALLRNRPTPARPALRDTAMLAPSWLSLLAVLALGLAMPDGLAAWIGAIATGAP